MTEISKWLIIQETKIKLRKKNKKKQLQEQVPLLCQGVIFCSRWLFNLAIHNVTQCLRPKGKQFETVFRAHIFEHENVKPMKHIMQGQGRSPSNFRLDASLNVLFFFFPPKKTSQKLEVLHATLCVGRRRKEMSPTKGSHSLPTWSRPWVLSPSKRWATATKRHHALTLAIKCSSSSSRLLRCAGTATERDLGKDLAIKSKDRGKCTFLGINLWIHCENVSQSRQNPPANTSHH